MWRRWEQIRSGGRFGFWYGIEVAVASESCHLGHCRLTRRVINIYMSPPILMEGRSDDADYESQIGRLLCEPECV
jgi:hypothetical protein